MVNETSMIITFLWVSTGVAPCYNYTITAVAGIIPHETDIADNTMSSDMTVRVRLVGDLNDDGMIDIKDIAMTTYFLESYQRVQDGCLMDLT